MLRSEADLDTVAGIVRYRDQLDDFMTTLHAESMARSERRRAALYQQPWSEKYERAALEIWAEGAFEYARRLLRMKLPIDAEEEVRLAWYSLGALHRLTIGLPPHPPTHRHIATAISSLVNECERVRVRGPAGDPDLAAAQ